MMRGGNVNHRLTAINNEVMTRDQIVDETNQKILKLKQRAALLLKESAGETPTVVRAREHEDRWRDIYLLETMTGEVGTRLPVDEQRLIEIHTQLTTDAVELEPEEDRPGMRQQRRRLHRAVLDLWHIITNETLDQLRQGLTTEEQELMPSRQGRQQTVDNWLQQPLTALQQALHDLDPIVRMMIEQQVAQRQVAQLGLNDVGRAMVMKLGAYFLRRWLALSPDEQIRWLNMDPLEQQAFLTTTPKNVKKEKEKEKELDDGSYKGLPTIFFTILQMFLAIFNSLYLSFCVCVLSLTTIINTFLCINTISQNRSICNCTYCGKNF